MKLHCENPPGLLTSDLKGTIVTAITSDRPVVIIVEGEEDLAPIIVHLAKTPRNNGPLWATWGRCGAPADHVGGQGALSAIARILRGDRLTLVTLTVCARDAEDWVEGCLDALLAQSHRPIEIIAVNDGSRDRTSEAMHAWAGAHESDTVRIEIIDQPPSDSLQDAKRLWIVRRGNGWPSPTSTAGHKRFGLKRCWKRASGCRGRT